MAKLPNMHKTPLHTNSLPAHQYDGLSYLYPSVNLYYTRLYFLKADPSYLPSQPTCPILLHPPLSVPQAETCLETAFIPSLTTFSISPHSNARNASISSAPRSASPLCRPTTLRKMSVEIHRVIDTKYWPLL